MKAVAVVALLVSLLAARMQSDLPSAIDAFARKAMQQIGTTPGLAGVVVKVETVLYRGDFGLCDVARRLPVAPDTRFYMASTTKAFTDFADDLRLSAADVEVIAIGCVRSAIGTRSSSCGIRRCWIRPTNLSWSWP